MSSGIALMLNWLISMWVAPIRIETGRYEGSDHVRYVEMVLRMKNMLFFIVPSIMISENSFLTENRL